MTDPTKNRRKEILGLSTKERQAYWSFRKSNDHSKAMSLAKRKSTSKASIDNTEKTKARKLSYKKRVNVGTKKATPIKGDQYEIKDYSRRVKNKDGSYITVKVKGHRRDNVFGHGDRMYNTPAGKRTEMYSRAGSALTDRRKYKGN